MYTRAVPGDKVVPDVTIGTVDGGDSVGPLWECQKSISNSQKDRCNRGGFCMVTEDRPCGKGVTEACEQGGEGGNRSI